MITGEHSYIRAAEPDDAAALHVFYDIRRPCSALLDAKREPLMPTVDELREMLGHKDAARGAFHAVEDKTGVIRGFCGLRGVNHEAGIGEIMLMFAEDATFEGPVAEEALAFVSAFAFERLRLRKLLAHVLGPEQALRGFLLRRGFVREGIQREVFFAGGTYHPLEVLSQFACR